MCYWDFSSVPQLFLLGFQEPFSRWSPLRGWESLQVREEGLSHGESSELITETGGVGKETGRDGRQGSGY